MAKRRVGKITYKVQYRVRTQVQQTVRYQPPPARPMNTSATPASIQPPPARQTTSKATRRLSPGTSPVTQVGENIREVLGDDPREYDVFISHASPDKDDVVRPLAQLLHAGGLEVWYDEYTLKVGDSLRQKIDQGIRSARFGIVVLSPAFLSGRAWTEHELDGIVNAYIYNRQVLLPIWHRVTHSDVMDYSPSLADKVALSTSEMTIEQIAGELLADMGPKQAARTVTEDGNDTSPTSSST